MLPDDMRTTYIISGEISLSCRPHVVLKPSAVRFHTKKQFPLKEQTAMLKHTEATLPDPSTHAFSLSNTLPELTSGAYVRSSADNRKQEEDRRDVNCQD